MPPLEYCKDHVTFVATLSEVKRDVKWIVCEMKKQNATYVKHIDEGDKNYRPQIAKNTAFRVILMWFVGSGTLITLAVYVMMMILKVKG